MFESPTTIIVGAGASFDLGLPLGMQLWSDVKHMLQSIHLAVMPPPSRIYSDVFVLTPVRLVSINSPCTQAMLKALKLSSRDARQPLYELFDMVQGSDVHASVDDFLRDHPGVRKEMKIAIAAVLFEKLYEESEGRWVRAERLMQLDLDGPGGKTTNWCRQFVGVCRPFLRKGRRHHKLTIVNFNYDRIFETVLRNFWGRSERNYPPFEECFEFLYPYGAFDELPSTLDDPTSWICDQSTKLGLADGDDGNSVDEIRKRLESSETIFTIGFSCARTNQNLLGLDTRHMYKIFYQNFDGRDSRLDRVMSGIGVEPNRRDTGNMAALMANGFFDQSARN